MRFQLYSWTMDLKINLSGECCDRDSTVIVSEDDANQGVNESD